MVACYHFLMPHSDAIPDPGLPAPTYRAFEQVSFSRQFLVGGTVLLVLAMLAVGTWVGLEIERSAVNRAAAVSAIYVESILATQLRHASAEVLASPETLDTLDRIFSDGPLRRKVVRFKLWDADGVIRYSSDHSQIGTRYPVDGLLAAAFTGKVESRISKLDSEDNRTERAQWQRLLEVYVPVRVGPQDGIIAVAEFYLATENLDRDIFEAKMRSWALVAGGTLAVILLMFGQVRRANETILNQRDDLVRQLQQMRITFEENERMRQRLGEAGAATTALNEEFLRRIAADLHDGPAQTLAFALMRFDELAASCGTCSRSGGMASPDLPKIRDALRASLDDLRSVAAGLGVPGIAELSLAETVQRAVRNCERQFAIKVETDIGALPAAAALATKITVYRLLQESLSNSARHAPGGSPQVRVWQTGGQICLEIIDQGAGFDPQAVAHSGRLGLAFMQERVRLLGGTFGLVTAPDRGTHICVYLPLAIEEIQHD
jgi:signal transduction histidine kinase